MLINEVYPRLRNAAHSIPKVQSEDDLDLIQDTTLMAARMMEAAEKAGQKYTAGNMAYYAVKAARSGRRSHFTGKCDVMSARCQFLKMSRLEDLDAEVEFETGDTGTMHDVVGSYGYQGQESDVAEEAARNVDWASFLASHPPRHRVAIEVLLEGGTMREAGKRCGIGDSAALLLKRRIASDLIEYFGEDEIRRLLDGIKPGWASDLQMSRARNHRSETAFQPQTQPVG